MSNFEQRRNVPRRQVRGGSRMHPGWACFLLAWGSGLFAAFAMLATIQWAMLKLPFGYVAFLWVAWMALFKPKIVDQPADAGSLRKRDFLLCGRFELVAESSKHAEIVS